MTYTTFIAQNPATNSQPNSVNLQGTHVLLGILLSAATLLIIAIKIISGFNSLVAQLKEVREDLDNHVKAEGHEKLVEKFRQLEKELSSFDKKIDLHLQDYANHKDSNLLDRNGLRERIDHKWERTEDLFKETDTEIKDLQRFLQKQQNFNIRE